MIYAATIGGFTWGGIVLIFMAFVELFVLIRLSSYLGAIYRALGQQMVQAKILNDNLMAHAEKLGELGRETSARLADEIMRERQDSEQEIYEDSKGEEKIREANGE